MSVLLTILGRILNPRSNLSRLHRSPRSRQEHMGQLTQHRLRARDVLGNIPLMIGVLIVLGLFLVVLFGPLWATENPYLAGQRTISYNEAGAIIAPPFAPSAEFVLGTDQWGRDILSLLLYGTRNTLIAATFITMSRLLLGLFLGAIAGWNQGSLVDRVIMGIVGTATALPTLITSMILIYALDIRRGVVVFIIALSLVGWGEMAEYIRSEFMVIRKKPYVEGAHVMGLRELDIAVRHVLPNVLPQLVVITLLEMGAVLMLLGELSFVGVFIGGGIQDETVARAVVIPDIPEWGAMMADSWRWARANPWMVFYPALAFFLAVVGFNALGEGLRRLVEEGGFSTAFLLRKRMLLVIATITIATVYIINNVGPAPSYARLAGEFDGQRAYEFVQALAQLDGRGTGQPGNQAAAEYIAERFHEYGVQPGIRGQSYFYNVPTRLVQAVEQPILTLLDEQDQPVRAFRHQLDFGFVIEGHGGGGHVQAPVTFVGFRPGQSRDGQAYRGLDLRGRVVLLLADSAPADFPTEALIRGAQGVIWVVGDGPHDVRSQIQLAGVGGDYLRLPTMPIYRVRPAVAEALLAPAGVDLAALRALTENWPTSDQSWVTQDLDTRVGMSLALSEPQEVQMQTVLGVLPGQDLALDGQLVMVSAHYDGLGRDPDDTIFTAANDDATGIAAMLEIARLWHERDVKPRRTVLFAAWAGGELDHSGAQEFVLNYSGGISILQPVAVFQLDNLGAGGDKLAISPEEGKLADLLAWSANQIGLAVQRENRAYHDYQRTIWQRRPAILVSWADSWVEPQLDTLDRISIKKLEEAGNAIALALIHASREPSF
ncbi:MAG: M28 family peptidase [Chloroflexi bacterium]|nr:M28 family peptidase [Chloroflexota bacterium]MBU1746394.1 M28 family peptidase [Chloroflexota bacterium]